MLLGRPYTQFLATSAFAFLNTAAAPKTTRDTDNAIIVYAHPAQYPPEKILHKIPVSWR